MRRNIDYSPRGRWGNGGNGGKCCRGTTEPNRFANILPAIVCIPALSARQRQNSKKMRKEQGPAEKRKIKNRRRIPIAAQISQGCCLFNRIFLSLSCL